MHAVHIYRSWTVEVGYLAVRPQQLRRLVFDRTNCGTAGILPRLTPLDVGLCRKHKFTVKCNNQNVDRGILWKVRLGIRSEREKVSRYLEDVCFVK